MYPPAARSASAGSGPAAFATELRPAVRRRPGRAPALAPRRRVALFRRVPGARLMTLWTAPGRREVRHDLTSIASDLAPLPLLLWETPPGLELILAQEGIAVPRVRDPHPLAFRAAGSCSSTAGRSPRRRSAAAAHARPRRDRRRPAPPGASRSTRSRALIDTRAAPATWEVGGWTPDRAGRAPAQGARSAAADRPAPRGVAAAGGLWARLAPFPFPYRSAFNFRADLDEPVADDYARFARRPRPAGRLLHPLRQHPRLRRRARRSSPTCAGSTPSRTGITTSSTATPRRTGGTSQRAHRILARGGLRARRLRRAPRAMERRASTRCSRSSATTTRPTSSSATTTCRSSPGGTTGSRGSSRCPIHPICEGLFLDAGVRDGRVDRRPPGRGRPGEGRRRASRRSSTATPSGGWGGIPEILVGAGRGGRPASRCSGGSR